MRRGITISFWFLCLALAVSAYAQDLAVIADQEFGRTVQILRSKISFQLLEAGEISSRKLCSFEKLLVLGPKSYLRIKDINCPRQERYLGGVLYPDLLGVPAEIILVSPLPSCEILGQYGLQWVVIHSRYLKYYVHYLASCFSIKAMEVEDPYHLPELTIEIRKTLDQGYHLLILPDPLFLERRGRIFLRDFLVRYRPRSLDLLGLEGVGVPVLPFSPQIYAQTLYQAIRKRITLFYGEGLR